MSEVTQNDLDSLRHDLEMAVKNLAAGAARQITDLERNAEILIRNQYDEIRQLHKLVAALTEQLSLAQQQFLQFLTDAHEPLANAFNEHGHEVPTGMGNMPSSRSIRVDG